MIRILIYCAIIFTAWQMPPDTDTRSGFLSGYADGVMERVIEANDGENFTGWMGYVASEAARLDGYVAVAHCGRRGELATLEANGRLYRVLVVDCLAANDRRHGNIFDRPPGYIAEVDYKLCLEICGEWAVLAFDNPAPTD